MDASTMHELLGLELAEDDSAVVMDTMAPSTLSDDEGGAPAALTTLGLLWGAADLDTSALPAVTTTSGPRGEELHLLFSSDALGDVNKPRRGRKPSRTPREKKPKRAPPTAAKARLRTYERRSRHKREHTRVQMKAMVEAMEQRIATATRHVDKAENSPAAQKAIHTLAMEAILLTHQNYQLRQAIDDHHFFHSMLQLEYDHRETTPDHIQAADFLTPSTWHPMDQEACFALMRDSYHEIDDFANSEDFISSGLEICGWREKRKLAGNCVKFLFHKQFQKECSDELAARSWEMRAMQDQVTRYFGPFLNVQVEIIQRLAEDVVIVRRKITHTVDGWVHHTIYLLFRTKTPDGHLVCIRDMNPEDASLLGLDPPTSTPAAPSCVIWSNCFVWWKFTTLPDMEPCSPPGVDQPLPMHNNTKGFQVEYGGSLTSSSASDSSFWMREVLLLALRWENLVVGPLITL